MVSFAVAPAAIVEAPFTSTSASTEVLAVVVITGLGLFWTVAVHGADAGLTAAVMRYVPVFASVTDCVTFTVLVAAHLIFPLTKALPGKTTVPVGVKSGLVPPLAEPTATGTFCEKKLLPAKCFARSSSLSVAEPEAGTPTVTVTDWVDGVDGLLAKKTSACFGVA